MLTQIGDSRAVLITSNDDVIPLSEDQKPDRVNQTNYDQGL